MAANRQTNQRITLVMLVLASITVITLDYRGDASHAINHVRNGVADALAPVQRGVAAALHPIGDVVSSTFHYGALQSQNAQLEQSLGEANAKLTQAEVESTTDADALKLFGLPDAPNVPKVLAEVISQSTSNFANDVEISAGTSSGVGKGMPVIADAGLVGRVVSASHSTATVALVTSASTALGVEDAKTGAFYDLVGAGVGKALTIATPSSSRPPHTGDVLVTSGRDAGAYPPDIPVGTVTSVSAAPGGLSVTVKVSPLADLVGLQFVAVLQWLAPA